MASVFFKRGVWWVRLKGSRVPGKWSSHPTDYTEEQKAAAEEYAEEAQNAIDERAAGTGKPNALTLREWIATWIKDRAESVSDWRKDLGRLTNHVLPVLGGADIRSITAAHVRALVHDLRFKKKLASRTVHNIYGVLAAVMRDAAIDGKIDKTPCVLDERQLGPIVDKDPKWRGSALFDREEAEVLISDARIPLDRRVVYGFGLLAGLRPGEAAALRWSSYDATWPVLGRLVVATAYSTTNSNEKGTKTNAVRFVPVHPTLAQLLAEWRLGWEQMFGRKPEPDDLIVPLPPDVKRTRRTGERFRGTDYTGKRWREEDLPMLGWRARSPYDTKSTFITLAIDDGANKAILRERVTHSKPRRDAFDGYDRGIHWEETCREILKLRVTTLSQRELTKRDTWLRRRVSNGGSSPPDLRVIQGGREDTSAAAVPGARPGHTSCYQASRCDDPITVGQR